MSHQEILAEVIEIVRETLDLEAADTVNPESLLFYHLAFTSMDMLDLIFRTEEAFNIAIPEGTIAGLVRGDMPEADFAADGLLTAAGRQRLINTLSDSPQEIFPERIRLNTLPRYCTVDAIARLVAHKLNGKT